MLAFTNRDTPDDADFEVRRLNRDGSPDFSFGNNGRRGIGFDKGAGIINNDQVTAVAVGPDGKIVVVGAVNVNSGSEFQFGIAQLTPDGALDGDFGDGGKRVVEFPTFPAPGGIRMANYPTAVAVARDGSGAVFVAGSVAMENGSDRDFTVIKLKPNGLLETSFGEGGKRSAFFDLGGAKRDYPTAMVLGEDGSVYVAGLAEKEVGSADFAVAKLTPSGRRDATFGDGGTQTIPFDRGNTNNDAALALAVDGSGAVVLAGLSMSAAGNTDFAVAKLTPNGEPDPAFGDGGKTTVFYVLDGPANDYPVGVSIGADGSITVVGSAVDANRGAFALARLTPTGAFDERFGPGGIQLIAFEVAPGEFQGIASGSAVQPDGKLIMVGGSGGKLLVARVLSADDPTPVLVGGSNTGGATVYEARQGRLEVGPAFAFPGLSGAIRTAVGDLDGDGIADYIGASGPGVPAKVVAVSGRDNSTVLVTHTPFADFTGGLFVAVADFDGDGRADLAVTPDQSGGPRITIFSGATDTDLANFLGIDDAKFRGGVRPGVGDVNGDGVPDLLVSAGFTGGPRVTIWDGAALLAGDFGSTAVLANFFAFEPGLRNGTFSAAADLNGDGKADPVFGAGPDCGPRVRVADAAALLAQKDMDATGVTIANFFAGPDTFRGGVRVLSRDLDGDTVADIVTGSGDKTASNVRQYSGRALLEAVAAGTAPNTVVDLDPFGQVLADGVFVG